jgi:hypothetical protein
MAKDGNTMPAGSLADDEVYVGRIAGEKLETDMRCEENHRAGYIAGVDVIDVGVEAGDDSTELPSSVLLLFMSTACPLLSCTAVGFGELLAEATESETDKEEEDDPFFKGPNGRSGGGKACDIGSKLGDVNAETGYFAQVGDSGGFVSENRVGCIFGELELVDIIWPGVMTEEGVIGRSEGDGWPTMRDR